MRYRSIACLGILIAFTTVAAMASPSVVMPFNGPTGIHPIGLNTSIVWTEKGDTFQLWHLDVANPANPVWTLLDVPAEVTAYLEHKHAKTGENFPLINVEFQGDTINLLWVQRAGAEDSGFKPKDLDAFVLVHASTILVRPSKRDQSQTWMVKRSAFHADSSMNFVERYTVIDNHKAWALLGGEESMGHRGQVLLATVDAGSTWKIMQSSPTGAIALPAEMAGPQATVAKDLLPAGTTGASPPVYAADDPNLGIAIAYTEHPKDYQHKNWHTFDMMQTADGGHSWRVNASKTMEQFTGGVNITVGVAHFSTWQNSAWLLLSTNGDNRFNLNNLPTLLHSSDQGSTWKVILRPSSYINPTGGGISTF